LAVTLDASGLVVGSYSGALCLSSNDPDESPVVVSLDLMVTDEQISGLTATNDSPTLLGETTTLTATVVSGTGVSYSWDFGDGETGTGAVVTHTYASVDTYTAVVTATNSVGEVTAQTTVVVNSLPVPSWQQYLPLVSKP
jgi:PKD repeat protein